MDHLAAEIWEEDDLKKAALTNLHQSWIDEAIASGPARPAGKSRWQKVPQRTLRRPPKQTP